MTLIEKLEKLSDDYFSLYTAYGDNADFNCENCGETMTIKVKVDIEYEVCD